MTIRFAFRSDVGRVRDGNEDCVYCGASDRGYLFVVADGMGGVAAGEVASRMAVDIVSQSYLASGEEAGAALAGALREANRRILEESEARREASGMGTTCTALAVVGDRAYVAHVGDSRVYRMRAGAIERLSRDQSVWADRVRAGASPSSEYGRNVLLLAVGQESELRPMGRADLDVAAGDRFLLCSDGLWGLITDPELYAVASARSPEQACVELVELANRRGGPDNISVVVVEVVDDSPAEGDAA